MTSTLNLRQVEAFKVVVDRGTVSLAAKQLQVTQPAVSRLIARFERATELKLFDREGGRMVLTQSGRRLYQEVEIIFARLRQVEAAVEDIKREDHDVC